MSLVGRLRRKAVINSLNASTKISRIPALTPGPIKGSVTLKNVVNLPAPNQDADSS